MYGVLESLTPTRLTGMAAYTISALACSSAWRRRRQDGRPWRLFAALTGLQLLLLLDMAFNWRWMLHDFWVQVAVVHGVYDRRFTPQLLAVALLVVVLAVVSLCALYRFRRTPGRGLVLTSSLLSVGLWGCECLSYHQIDRVLYGMFGQVMMITLLWVGLTIVLCLGVWLDRRMPGSVRQ